MKTKLMLALVATLAYTGAVLAAGSRPVASRDLAGAPAIEASILDPGRTGVDYIAAQQLGAGYLKGMQADITEDNAGNGDPDVPDDPDDGGWDWVVASPSFSHSTAASPTNIYGATAQGLYYSYLDTGDAAQFTALTDAANNMVADATIDSAADLVFLMLYDDLPSVGGTAFADAARLKFDAKAIAWTTIIGYVEMIRDVRFGQGYGNGIIAWDIGAWARVAAMLDARYPGSGYDTDADGIAEVIWQDSFNGNPGYFDIVADAGFDPGYGNYDFYWYNLGVTGLIDAFDASGAHTDEIPGLVTRLLAGQNANGAITFQYGGNAGDEDWQSTAYAMISLGLLDQSTHQLAINAMGTWLAGQQDPASGAWIYSTGNHYPEIGGECTAGFYFTADLPVPAVSEWGLVLMTLVGLTLATILLRRIREQGAVG